MASKKWSSPDFANSGQFYSLPFQTDLIPFVKERFESGWELVSVRAADDNFSLGFAKRDSRDCSVWEFDYEGERGLEEGLQERVLNNSRLAGMELVGVWCNPEHRGNVARYFCRRAVYSDDPIIEWETKVIELPVSSLSALFESLSPLRRRGWVYRGHIEVSETMQPQRHGFFLVYLQKEKKQANIPS